MSSGSYVQPYFQLQVTENLVPSCSQMRNPTTYVGDTRSPTVVPAAGPRPFLPSLLQKWLDEPLKSPRVTNFIPKAICWCYLEVRTLGRNQVEMRL